MLKAVLKHLYFPVAVASVHLHPYIQPCKYPRAAAGRFPTVLLFIRSRSPNLSFTGAISTMAKSTGAFSRGQVLRLCA